MCEQVKDTTTVPSGTLVILAPGDVRPGHMMLAPLRMKRMAPLSTCIFGQMKGSAEEAKHRLERLTVWLLEGACLHH